MTGIVVEVGPVAHQTSRGPLFLDRQLNPACLALLVAAFIELDDTHGRGWGHAVKAVLHEGSVELHCIDFRWKGIAPVDREAIEVITLTPNVGHGKESA
jgi:hypothetical protein